MKETLNWRRKVMSMSVLGTWLLRLSKACAITSGAAFAGWLILERSGFYVAATFGLLILSWMNAALGSKFLGSLSNKQKGAKLSALPLYMGATFLTLLGLAFLASLLAEGWAENHRLSFTAVSFLGGLLLWIRASTEWDYGEDKSNPYFRQWKGEPTSQGPEK